MERERPQVSLCVRVPEIGTRRSDPSRAVTKGAPDAGEAILSENDGERENSGRAMATIKRAAS